MAFTSSARVRPRRRFLRPMRCGLTSGLEMWRKRSARSKVWICASGPSITTWRSASAPISSCACWPTMSSGICARRSRRCSMRTKRWTTTARHVIPWRRPCHRLPSETNAPPRNRPMGCRCDAGMVSSVRYRPWFATPVEWAKARRQCASNAIQNRTPTRTACSNFSRKTPRGGQTSVPSNRNGITPSVTTSSRWNGEGCA